MIRKILMNEADSYVNENAFSYKKAKDLGFKETGFGYFITEDGEIAAISTDNGSRLIILEAGKRKLQKGKPTDKGTERFYYAAHDGETHMVTKDHAKLKGWSPANARDVKKHKNNSERKVKDSMKGKRPAKKGKVNSKSRIKHSKKREKQLELEGKRDMAIAGAGGAKASQGESRFCSAMNMLNEKKFKKENAGEINKIIENKNWDKPYPGKAEDARNLEAIGLNLNDNEGKEYIATREIFAQQELARIKGINNSVFHSKQGFNKNEKEYNRWMRAAYDGAIANKKILKEDTNIDTTKPMTTVQSTSEGGGIDKEMLAELESLEKKATDADDKKYYKKQIANFKKNREYHDTYVVGQDEKGRTTIVSISNKQAWDLSDPHSSSTPLTRFKNLKKLVEEQNLSPEVAKTIQNNINTNIESLQDSKKATIKATISVEIDENLVTLCKTKEIQSYMKQLDDYADINKKRPSPLAKYLESQEIENWPSLPIKNKLELMKESAAEQLSGQPPKTPAERPYGKIFTKIGELASSERFRNMYPEINFESKGIAKSSEIKNAEKTSISEAHKKLVKSLVGGDKKSGYPDSEGNNGPLIKSYISTVLESMHYTSDVFDEDGSMIKLSGGRGIQPSQIRSCLGELSGFDGNLKTKKGRNDLLEHLQNKCKVDSKTGTISVTDDAGDNELAFDVWRTAGSNSKVSTSFGSTMRECLGSKVDEKRKITK